jgi:hypothetical protein
MKHTYTIVVSSARMPSSCSGKYARIGIVRSPVNAPAPTRICTTKVHTVVRTWESLHVGKTHACAFERALKAAEKELARLNGGKS